MMKNARLKGIHSGAIRSLDGFQKGLHTVPDGRTDATMRFVRKAGTANVTAALDLIYRDLKDVMGYKRRHLNSVDDFGSASIKTPDFDVNLWIEQDAVAEETYALVTEVATLRRPEVILEEPFQRMFSKHCDQVIFDFKEAVNLDDKIAILEDMEELDGRLVDERDGSAFTLTLNDPPVRLRVTSADLTISLTAGRSLKTLIESAMQAVAKMSLNGMQVLPVSGLV